jgi:hypothetical protein
VSLLVSPEVIVVFNRGGVQSNAKLGHKTLEGGIKVKALIVLLFCGLILEGQTAPKQAAPKAAPKAVPAETPEHKHAQAELLNALTNYNKQLAQFAAMCHDTLPDDNDCRTSPVEYRTGDPGQLLKDVMLQGLEAELATSKLNLDAVKRSSREDEWKQMVRTMKGFGIRNTDAFSVLLQRLQQAEPCMTTYRSTINKRTSDLTVGETETISACRELESYPPKRD